MALLVAGLLAAAIAYGTTLLPSGAPPWAAPTLAVAAVVIMTATAVLAVGRAGAGALVGTLIGGGVVLALALAYLWTLPPVGSDTRLVLGLPPGAALLVYGLGLAPALVVPLVYAWSFDRATLSKEGLQRVREAASHRPDFHGDEAQSANDETGAPHA